MIIGWQGFIFKINFYSNNILFIFHFTLLVKFDLNAQSLFHDQSIISSNQLVEKLFHPSQLYEQAGRVFPFLNHRFQPYSQSLHEWLLLSMSTIELSDHVPSLTQVEVRQSIEFAFLLLIQYLHKKNDYAQ